MGISPSFGTLLLVPLFPCNILPLQKHCTYLVGISSNAWQWESCFNNSGGEAFYLAWRLGPLSFVNHIPSFLFVGFDRMMAIFSS
jgi:hypothetical protein